MKARELLGAGALSIAVVAGAGAAALIAANEHTDKVAACEQVDRSLQKDCVNAAGDFEGIEDTAGLMAAAGIAGLGLVGWGLFREWQIDIYGEVRPIDP